MQDQKYDQAYKQISKAMAGGKDAEAWAVGLNWYMNKNVKFAFDYEQTKFERGATGGGDRPDEKLVLGRMQLAY